MRKRHTMIGHKIFLGGVLSAFFPGVCPAAAPPGESSVFCIRIKGANPGDTLALTEYDATNKEYRTDTTAVFAPETDSVILTASRTGRMLSLSYRPTDDRPQNRWPVFAENGVQYTVEIAAPDAPRADITGGVYDAAEMKNIRMSGHIADSLAERLKTLRDKTDTAQTAQTRAALEKALQNEVYAKERFIIFHPENGYSAYLISDLIKSIPERTTLDRVRRLYNSLNGGARNTQAGQVANEEIYTLISASEGASVPRFTRTALEGELISPAHYRGKWLVLDFWASWCGACRAANPAMVETYEKYHPQGLEIIGIATWDRPESWRQAIREDGLPWIHVNGGEKAPGQQTIDELFLVSSIPTVILVDPEGKIVFRGRPEGLRGKLAETFGN